MRSFSKRTVAIVTASTVLFVGGGLAYAYWTAGGSGTGGATAGTNAPLVAKQTSTVADLRPGGAAQALTGNFDNPNAGTAYVTTVTVSIGSVTKSMGAVAGTCDSTDFTLAGAAMTVNADVPTGLAKGAWTGATIVFNNKPAANQDACKLATVNLVYTIV